MGGSSGGKGGDGGYGDMISSIQQAAQISQQYSDKAVEALKGTYAQASNQINQGGQLSRADLQTAQQQALGQLAAGGQQAKQAFQGATQQAGTYLAPYINTGLPALDAYADSMGLPRPSQGSLAVFNQQQQANTAADNANQSALDQYQNQLNAYNKQQLEFNNQLAALGISNPTNNAAVNAAAGPGGAASGQGGYVYDPTSGIASNQAASAASRKNLVDQINAAVQVRNSWDNPGIAPTGSAELKSLLRQNGIKDLNQATPEQLAKIGGIFSNDFNNLATVSNPGMRKNSPVAASLGAALKGVVAPNSVNIGQAPVSPNAPTLPGAQTPIAAAPEMTAAGSQNQSALQNFYASPEAQVIYGGNPMDMSQQSVEERFKNDPGYQFQLQQGLKAVQNSNIAKGLGYSPAMAQAMNDYASGYASQSFNQYRQGLASTFADYQNKLGQMAGMSQQATTQGAQLSQNTGQALGNLASGTSTNMANLTAGMGSNLSNSALATSGQLGNLTSNYGANLAGAYTGAGNTQANALLAQGQAQAAQSQYQNSANAQMFGGLGALAGAGIGGYFGGFPGANVGMKAGSLFSNFGG